jgi:hypothetical protein
MISDKSAPRLLGAAFLVVILTSLSGGLLLSSAVGAGSVADMLVSLSNQTALMRLSILGNMLTSCGIVALAALLYTVLSKQNKIIALVALGCWLAEAIFLALSQTGTAALIPLSLDFVKAGAPDHSYYQTLGQFLYSGIYHQGYTIHMWFYCTGGILWYSLFYQSKIIPRVISLFGVLAVSLGLVGIVLELFGYAVPIFVFLPILPFELTIGVWLLLRGVRGSSEHLTQAPASLRMPVASAKPYVRSFAADESRLR